MNHTLKTFLSLGGGGEGGEGFIDFNIFWDGVRGIVPLVNEVTIEKINCNGKQVKEMK